MKRRMICLALALLCLLTAALTGCRKKTNLPDEAPVEDTGLLPAEPTAPEAREGIDTPDTSHVFEVEDESQTVPEQDGGDMADAPEEPDDPTPPEEPDDPPPPEETPDEGAAYTPGENETSIIWFG